MCNTYFVRFPISDEDRGASPGTALRSSSTAVRFDTEPPRPPLEPRPVKENELKYLMHLRDIQNMMRLIIDSYDGLAPLVKYVNWSDMSRTRRLFQAAIFATVLLYFVGPYVPLRLTLLVVGELALIAHHPWVAPSIAAMHKSTSKGPGALRRMQRKRRLHQRLHDVLEEDGLPESVWQRGFRDVELFENQRLHATKRGAAADAWSSLTLVGDDRRPWTCGSDGWTSADENHNAVESSPEHVPYTLEPGWEWIEGDSWRIDWGGAWSIVGVDDEGFVYTDNSWRHPAPYAYGSDKTAPSQPTRFSDLLETDDDETSTDTEDDAPRFYAVTRRRRWLRRAVRTADAYDSQGAPKTAA